MSNNLTKVGKYRVEDGKRNLERVVYIDSYGDYLVKFNGNWYPVKRIAYHGTYGDVEYYRL